MFLARTQLLLARSVRQIVVNATVMRGQAVVSISTRLYSVVPPLVNIASHTG